MKKSATLVLPSGFEIDLPDAGVTLENLIDTARNGLGDYRITPEEFGTSKHFFFVISTRGSLVDHNVDLSRPLKSFLSAGDVIELRLSDPDPEADGSRLNPMRGVTKFVR